MVNEINIQMLNCNRCGHKWIPRVIPVQCPKCKSYYWNENKDFDKRKEEYKNKELNEIKKNIIN